jgi:phospholipase D1/2
LRCRFDNGSTVKTLRSMSSRNATLAKRWAIVLALFALPAAWHLTPLSSWVDFETIAKWQESVRGSAAAPFIIVGAYLVGAVVFFPVTLLSMVTVFSFGPVTGGAYSMIGWLLSAILGYGVGRALGQDLLWGIAGPRLRRLELEARRHGFVAVLIMRLLPVAPFTLVNLFIGASRIRFRDFFFGSLVGRVPGLLVLMLFAFQLDHALRVPDVARWTGVALALLLVCACALLARRFDAKKTNG